MIRLKSLFSVALLIATFSPAANALDALEELKVCARLSDANERHECYEALGQRALATEAEAPMVTRPETAGAPAPVAESLPADLGGRVFANKDGEDPVEGRGRVTQCTLAVDKKWFYHFENGQVWKQVDSRRRRHSDCDFMVTIIKDGFGYKMQIDGEKSKIRINRRR